MVRPDKPRERALALLCEAERGGRADVLIEAARGEFAARDMAFINELVLGVLRNRAALDWALDRFSKHPVGETDEATRNLLRLGAYQLLFLSKVPPSAAVNTSTDLAKHHGKKSGYVNGLLRTLDRNRSVAANPSHPDPATDLALRYSHPLWLVRRWLRRFGPERCAEALRDNNRPAPLVIRANLVRTTRNNLAAALGAEGADAAPARLAPAGLEIRATPGLTAHAAYRDGWFMVQDEAAQLISLMLSPAAGERVLDACAAPGGKAAHLAELMNNQGEVIALDRSEQRLPRIAQNAARLGLTIIHPRAADAAAFRSGPFDKILVDAPCTGLGVLRRHPDGRWTKSEQSIRERAGVQRAILANAASLLKPGGVVVYAVCSVEPEENEDVVSTVLADLGGAFAVSDPRPFLPGAARSLVGPDLCLRTFPADTSLDGFFGCRIVRNP